MGNQAVVLQFDLPVDDELASAHVYDKNKQAAAIEV